MKFVVVSDKTIETALIKETILKDMKSDKEKELEKKQEEIKKKEEKKKEETNDNVIVKPPETKEKPPETKTTPPKPTNPSGKIIPKPKKPLMKNSPAAKAGIPTETRQKFANMNAAFQATKRKDSGYTKMDFIKDFPNSQTAKKFNKGKPIPGFK